MNISIITINSSVLKPLINGRDIPPNIPKEKHRLNPIARSSVGKCSSVVIVKIMLSICKAALEAIEAI